MLEESGTLVFFLFFAAILEATANKREELSIFFFVIFFTLFRKFFNDQFNDFKIKLI